jgi:dipeptidyl aminopeptidase/acylaminoacyl peptidase
VVRQSTSSTNRESGEATLPRLAHWTDSSWLKAGRSLGPSPLKRGLALLLIVGAVLVSGVAAGRCARLTFPGRNGRIVYAAPSAGLGWRLFTMNPDGSDTRLLTRDGGIAPAFSPDGKTLALTRGGGLFTMRAGPGARLGRRVATFGLDPAWSPDGRQIVFAALGISVVNRDGTGKRRLLKDSYGGAGQRSYDEPDWSPDGSRIVLVGGRTVDTGQIYVMGADGSGLRAITDDAAADASPSWSPDGKRILYARCNVHDTGDTELAVISPDGSTGTTIARLSQTQCVSDLTWSPDGRKIAFINDGNRVDVWPKFEVMNRDGTGRTEIPVRGFYGFSWQRKRSGAAPG